MMTASRPAPIHYGGDLQYLLAVHEAGHAVTHLLLGHHVCSVNLSFGDMGSHTNHGETTYSALGRTDLADMVGTAAGEAAVLHLVRQEHHLYSGPLAYASPSTIAAASAEHDREHIAGVAINTTLPAGIETEIASRILANHWDAVESVADALYRSPDGHLNDTAVRVAANLGSAEYDWDGLSALASEAVPGHPGVQQYLTGAGQQTENQLAEYLRQLRVHGVPYTPEPALRRDINREIFDRGMPEIQAALYAAIGGAQ